MADARAKVAAIIPTLERLSELQASVASVRAQSVVPDEILVVLNGSGPATREWASAQTDLHVVELHANTGPVEGFQRGIDAALAGGADVVWLMDDDAVAEPQTLAALLDALDTPEEPAAAAPVFATPGGSRNAGWLWGRRADGGHGQSRNVPGTSSFSDVVDWAPFAGLLVRSEVFAELGPLRSEFFLPHADMEICLRMRAADRLIRAVPGAVVHHPSYVTGRRRVGSRTVEMFRLDAWREYYDTRNFAILVRELRGTPLDLGTPWPERIRGELVRCAATILTDPHGGQRVRMRMLGYLDGVRRRLDRAVGPAR